MSLGLLLLYSFLAFCMCVVTAVVAMFQRSRARADVIFRYLGMIVRQNLPMPAALHYAAMAERGKTRYILAHCGRLTQWGLPLSEALRRAYGKCPADALSVVQAAERTGTLPAALVDFNERRSRHDASGSAGSKNRWAYLVLVGLIATVVVYGSGYFIAPRLRLIILDFDLILPEFSADVLAVASFQRATPTTLPGLLFQIAIVLLSLLPPALILAGVIRLAPRRPDRPGPLSIAGDFLKWSAGPVRRIAAAEGCARLIPALRQATAAGWPLPDAVDCACAVDANYFLRRRWRDWARLMRQGGEPAVAGRDAGLPEMLLRCVSIGVRDGDLDAPLHHAEQYYAALVHRWHKVLLQLLWPFATLALASVVAMFLLSTIIVLKALIDIGCAILS